jgi:hypothetical protein
MYLLKWGGNGDGDGEGYGNGGDYFSAGNGGMDDSYSRINYSYGDGWGDGGVLSYKNDPNRLDVIHLMYLAAVQPTCIY